MKFIIYFNPGIQMNNNNVCEIKNRKDENKREIKGNECQRRVSKKIFQ